MRGLANGQANQAGPIMWRCLRTGRPGHEDGAGFCSTWALGDAGSTVRAEVPAAELAGIKGGAGPSWAMWWRMRQRQKRSTGIEPRPGNRASARKDQKWMCWRWPARWKPGGGNLVLPPRRQAGVGTGRHVPAPRSRDGLWRRQCRRGSSISQAVLASGAEAARRPAADSRSKPHKARG